MTDQTWKVPADLEPAVQATMKEWAAGAKVARLWQRDASLWTGADEASWLGWLSVVGEQRARLADFRRLAEDARGGGFRHALLLGMGGSSLCPEVLAATFGAVPGHPELRVLDSTDPAQIRALDARIDPARTLFIVSSKSGSTLEPNIFKQYFFERARRAVGAEEAGRRFIAITDPGSKMERVAQGDGFRHVLHGVPSIGGRYSALSHFGLAPAAVMGLDVARLLDGAQGMVDRCAASIPIAENPGAMLGILMGTLGRMGRDKVTVIASPGIHDLGAWLEQLIAESTGKEGRGLIPVDREPTGGPRSYGLDRLFVYVRLAEAPDAAQDAVVAALEGDGHPVARITVASRHALAAEFFRWEFATAVAGSILGINPFDQPDVEASKVATRGLTDAYERSGTLPAEASAFEAEGVRLFTDERNAAAIASAAGPDPTLAGLLGAHLRRARPGDYVALLAYVEMSAGHERALQAMRGEVRERLRVATCLGFGPRFLHSTGQAYKGGPNSGIFLQITCDDAADLPVPGQTYTFGVVKAAQARGDFAVLAERGRRTLRAHLGKDVEAGLASLAAATRAALAAA